MSINYKIDLPKELVESAKSLEHLGISEMAWDWENAIRVVNFLNKNNCAIIGGDVYKMVEGNLQSTYDSWYFNKNESKSNVEFLQKSMNRAITYINRYYEENGKEYYYSIIITELK